MNRRLLSCAALSLLMTAAVPAWCPAEQQVLSTEPPVTEFQYQLHYPRLWGWPGPGLSMGGSLPAKGREGISSFYGMPFPAPMGAGVYMNPFGYSTRLPGPFSFGLAQSTPNMQNPNMMQNPGMPTNGPMPTGVDPSIMQANANPAPQNLLSVPKLLQSSQPVTSSAEAIRRAREVELIGDAHFKDRNWNQAFVNYRNAVIIAPDRAEAHYRLGIANAMLESFSEAANQLTRAVAIDPSLISARHIVDEIFGTGKRSIPNEIVLNAANWAKEDLKKPDRLLVLGVILQCARDSRSDEILAAAGRSFGLPDQYPQQMISNMPPRPTVTPAASLASFPR